MCLLNNSLRNFFYERLLNYQQKDLIKTLFIRKIIIKNTRIKEQEVIKIRKYVEEFFSSQKFN